MNKLQQILEDGKAYVSVLEASDICKQLNEMGYIFWVFPDLMSDDVLIELDPE